MADETYNPLVILETTRKSLWHHFQINVVCRMDATVSAGGVVCLTRFAAEVPFEAVDCNLVNCLT